MKVLIGITQDLDSAQDAVTEQFKGLGTSTNVGPFSTKAQAEEWVCFMKNRRNNYEEIEPKNTQGKDEGWFGFTFELNTVH
ncbi:MAG: hypothetical protein D3923_08590 [Candidatus Electrothrix sp. AR3]|nr:hypothetical protein [Candidatus Electrothrix sp. AR3]